MWSQWLTVTFSESLVFEKVQASRQVHRGLDVVSKGCFFFLTHSPQGVLFRMLKGADHQLSGLVVKFPPLNW